ncbi:MAG: excinuclease ABC subunit C [Flavobacteriaceae bacterium TMED184]|nr:MAG: excinuclease ABC subunit C [Flavobacteriaceae bacterium TMED184]
MDDNQIQLKSIPTLPGVYQFKNKDNKIIYIGKAKNLKNRVRSYFQNQKNKSSKTVSMMKNAYDLDWIVVENEVKALLTEANLIKKYRPKYNVLMKDDKSYPYIRITNEPFPQVLLTRKIKKDGSKYYGPFTDSRRLRSILKVMHKVFPIRSCSYFFDDKIIKEKKISLCLDYHIKRCEGPCEGLVSEKKYNKMINHVISFMNGNTNKIEEYIKSKMLIASNSMQYEDAARYRDQLNSIKGFSSKRSQIRSTYDDRDIFALASIDNIGIMVVIRIRNGFIYSREKISLQNLFYSDADTFKTVITSFYLNSNLIPPLISLPEKPTNDKNLLNLLTQERGAKVRFEYPKIGEKSKELSITMKNAELLLNEWVIKRKKYQENVPNVLSQLQNDLNLEVPPKTIEGFDVSHLGGTNTVASMVSFVNGKPRKNNYRKFNIRSVNKIDDFASIREVVFRRYNRLKKENVSFPDLILIDGGKGQLNMATSALRNLGLDYIPVIGLAKRLEEVFIPGNPDAQIIHKNSSGLVLLKRIRDEAHRFAISFQKNKRNKTMLESPLLDIVGVGQKTIKKLFIEFDDIKDISMQSSDTISKKIKLSKKLSKVIIKVSKSLL